MRHRTNKIKFQDGQDSNEMIMKKLMYNFLRHAHLTTSESKAKALKMYMDRIVSKTKEKTEANKNYLLRYFPNSAIIKILFEQVGPAVAKINGGFVKTTRINQRETDGALMVKVSWAHPVVIDWGDKPTSAPDAAKATAGEETSVTKKEVKKSASASKATADKEVKKVTKDK